MSVATDVFSAGEIAGVKLKNRVIRAGLKLFGRMMVPQHPYTALFQLTL